MILISVQYPGDVQLARAVLQGLGDRFEWFILFSDPEQKRRMGEIGCKYSFDAPFCMLNAPNFTSVVSFSGLLHPGMMPNILLLSFFNEIGVATFEIQHGLFQYGINNVDMADQVGSNLERGDQLAIPLGYAARKVLKWGGPEGIGYPKSVLTPRPTQRAEGYGLITSNNHWQIYQTHHRQRFGHAVSTLASSRPDLEFVWKPHFAEDLGLESKQVLDAVANMKLPNLHIERTGDAEDLIPGCAFGISTVSSTLVDFQVRGKPVLVNDTAPVRPMIEQMHVETFLDASDLPEKVASLLADPDRHMIRTGVEPFIPERLASHFERALELAKPSRDHLPVALKYLDYLRAQTRVAQPADLDQAVARISQDMARTAGSISQEVASTESNLTRTLLGAAGDIRQETTQVATHLSQTLHEVAGGIHQETTQVAANLSQTLHDVAGELRQETAQSATNLSQTVHHIARDMRQETTQVAAGLSRGMAVMTAGLERTSRKLTVVQRSTLAYKLKTLFKSSRTS